VSFLPDGITLTTLPNIVGLRPQSGPNALLVMDRPGLISENEWTQAAQQPLLSGLASWICLL
jgi:hypothetical protein